MPFNIDLDTDSPKFAVFFTGLEAEVKSTLAKGVTEKKYVKRRLANHLKLILLNLFKAYGQDRDRYVAYSNNKNTYYPQKEGAQGLKVSYEPFRSVLKALESLQYITIKLGFYFPGGHSAIARMRGTEKLHQYFQADQHTFPFENRIDLKDIDGFYLPFDDTIETHKLRNNLKAINDQLDQHFIALYLTDAQISDLKKRLRRENRSADLSKTRLKRTFSHGSFELGGRFYGGFWISLFKDYRHYVRIDHAETVILDFSATVVNLIYLDKSLSLPEGDAYVFPGADSRDREALKIAVMMMVNETSRTAAIKAINFEVICKKNLFRKYSAEEIVTALELKHAPIQDKFYKALGVAYQYKESVIAEAVMLRFVQEKRAALPIHDGFLVKREDAIFLAAVMIEEVVAIYGRPLPYKQDGPSKLSFLPSKNEWVNYSHYYGLWQGWESARGGSDGGGESQSQLGGGELQAVDGGLSIAM